MSRTNLCPISGFFIFNKLFIKEQSNQHVDDAACCGKASMTGIWILFIFMLSSTLCVSFSPKNHHTVIAGVSSGGLTFYNKIHSSGGRILPLVLTYQEQSIGDENVKPATLRPPVLYGPHKYSQADFNSLQRRVRVLECLVGELCGALLHSATNTSDVLSRDV